MSRIQDFFIGTFTFLECSRILKIDSLVKDSELIEYEGDHFFFVKNSEDISKNVERTFLDTLGK